MTNAADFNIIPGLVSKARRKLFLTGTPILNKPIEMQPLLAAIAPATFGDFWRFAKRYCGATKGQYGWDFSGASNLEELQELLRATCMVRRLKADVLTELPPKRRQVVVLPTNGAARAVSAECDAYDDSMADYEAEVVIAEASSDPAAYRAAAAKLDAARRVAFDEISARRHATALAKVPAVIEHVEDALENTDGKIILFAHHKDVIAKIVSHFGAIAVQLTGDTANDDRTIAVDRFQTDKTIRLFVGSIGACREGLTLTAASTVIFAELDWVPGNVTQAEDRAHRIGQRESVLIQHLVLDGSLDARMVGIIIAKQAIADAALDHSTAVVVSDEAVAAKAKRETRQAEKPAAPACSEEQRAAAHLAMRTLAGMCDGAIGKDDSGFARIDVAIGHKLAKLGRLSDGQVGLAARLATKYRRQLDAELVTLAGGSAESKPRKSRKAKPVQS